MENNQNKDRNPNSGKPSNPQNESNNNDRKNEGNTNDRKVGNNPRGETNDSINNASTGNNNPGGTKQSFNENSGNKNDINGSRDYKSQAPDIDSTTNPPVSKRNNSFDEQNEEPRIEDENQDKNRKGLEEKDTDEARERTT